MSTTILAILGSVIIIGLASYAGFLLIKLKKQKQLIEISKQRALEKRNANIYDNVRTLCMAGIEKQCDVSEITIRVYCILDYIQGDKRIDFAKDYPAILELYHVVKDMARGPEREKLAKKDRMAQNLARLKAEARLEDQIIEELKQLKKYVEPFNNQIDIKMM